MKKLIILLIVLLSAVWCGSAADAAIIVGRISHVEGDLFRYMDAEKSWVETHLQSPAGIEDVLATGYNSRAEITIRYFKTELLWFIPIAILRNPNISHY